jgi:hypothetical protein
LFDEDAGNDSSNPPDISIFFLTLNFLLFLWLISSLFREDVCFDNVVDDDEDDDEDDGSFLFSLTAFALWANILELLLTFCDDDDELCVENESAILARLPVFWPHNGFIGNLLEIHFFGNGTLLITVEISWGGVVIELSSS